VAARYARVFPSASLSRRVGTFLLPPSRSCRVRVRTPLGSGSQLRDRLGAWIVALAPLLGIGPLTMQTACRGGQPSGSRWVFAR